MDVGCEDRGRGVNKIVSGLFLTVGFGTSDVQNLLPWNKLFA
jgi:hypothetical protein